MNRPVFVSLCLLLAACGQSGDLYLPQADARRPAARESAPPPPAAAERPTPQQREGQPDEDAETPAAPADPTPPLIPPESP